MGRKYIVKLKGTNCYLRSTGEKSINFTTDIKKAKVFETDYKKSDFIDKMIAKEYKPNRNSRKCDHIRLTMDRATWMEMYNEHLDQIQAISNSRMMVHQYSISLERKFELKAKTFQICGEHPNFECDYYGEDFEREEL